MSYIPEPTSVAGLVCAFFRQNRTAELSTVEIALQFKKPTNAIHALLATPIQHQLLARRKDEQGNLVWFAGPKLGALHLAAPAPDELAQALAPRAVTPPPAPIPPPHPADLHIEVAQLVSVDTATVEALQAAIKTSPDTYREPYRAAGTVDGRANRLAREVLLQLVARTDIPPDAGRNAHAFAEVAFELADAFIAALDKRQASTQFPAASAA